MKKLIKDLGYSEFDEELWIDITRSKTRLEVALRGSSHDSLIDGVTSHQFLEFAEQYTSKHSEESTRSSALQSAMGLCGSLSPFENSTSKALIQTSRLLLGCLLILFQLPHLEDSSLELTFKLFHKYDLALSRTSITVFQDRQALNQTLAEKLQFSVEWVVYLHMRTESSARYQTAISDMTDYGLKCLDRASFWLYAHHSQKSTGRFATESEDPEKQPKSQTMGLYEFRSKPGAGTATFATQAIPRGTIIMEEQPLLSAPMRKSFRSPFEVWNRLDEQPEERQRDFRALFHSVPKLNQVRERADQLMDKLLVDDTDVDVSDAILVTGIYDTNAFRGGVYRDQSRMNHMCTFNAMQGVRDDGSQYMEAMRNIKKGEELTCPYVNTLDPYEYRQRSLELWGFTCTCPLCEMEQFVQETSCLGKEETEPGFDLDELEAMIKFMRIWFEAVQTTCDTDERRWRAELYMVEVEDAGLMFERAYRLFDCIQERSPSDQTEANKVTIENILDDLKTSRQYWRPDDDDDEEGGRRRRTLRKAVNFARRLGRAFHIKHR
ncbi:hypothetical protein GTA08_BOTSDO06022 [Botryosphaeria dothidea]|uniref:SET domain-containing protein n=1 Tax=Botryosphaeria dothidea TaxID=55169 RepID=A0A8H4N0K9_9PEZI|nr:hypothetical protein GTA08_BOTSDO06022 [Botryosphaeria dothidea]